MNTATTTWLEGDVKEPLNRAPNPNQLTKHFISDKDVYDRNHGPIPHINVETHRVHLAGAVKTPASLSISDLRSLPQHTVLAALQCAGNRRHTMRTKVKEVWGLDWNEAAVMNCKWTGPLLHDVLTLAGGGVTLDPTLSTNHVEFSCHQTVVEDDDHYAGSVPLAWAVDPDREIVLALDMNDHPLTPKRGFPVRVIVPGVAGARAVKWLDKITVQDHESRNKYQQRDYKILPADVQTKESAEKAWGSVPAMQYMPVNSVISSPRDGEEVEVPLTISGYALPQGQDGPITKVEVSVDKGETWNEAEIVDKEKASKWSWVLWKFVYDGAVDKDTVFLSRASDTKNRQGGERPWNLRGVGYDWYGEVTGLKVKSQ